MGLGMEKNSINTENGGRCSELVGTYLEISVNQLIHCSYEDCYRKMKDIPSTTKMKDVEANLSQNVRLETSRGIICERTNATKIPPEPTKLLKNHILSVISPDCPDTIRQMDAVNAINSNMCIFCHKICNGTSHLMQHIFQHYNVKSFGCFKCSEKFQEVSAFRKRMMNKHCVDIYQQNFQCQFCSETKQTLYDFVGHTFTNHLDERSRNNSDLDSKFCYDCPFCFEKFDKYKEASSHLNEHGADVLGKYTLSTTRNLSERAKSGLYTAELLYNCMYCTKTLCGSYEARLIPYRCLICGEQFRERWIANRHMIDIHAMEAAVSKFDCRYCEAEFKNEIDFINHMFNDHLYINFNIEENLDGKCTY
ncbi:PR domain zinc finger protein 10 [Pseudolycoriella hygida]|uniref:PR domain zinc finger protein 10 n=1 Tax=Pseudolycoriella hygida TaxID=35572 RepID=A0A9Q0MNY7_9DIPT|nr:PR domain zinc finger protein 10 [Pseudolycoriella hygida]